MIYLLFKCSNCLTSTHCLSLSGMLYITLCDKGMLYHSFIFMNSINASFIYTLISPKDFGLRLYIMPSPPPPPQSEPTQQLLFSQLLSSE